MPNNSKDSRQGRLLVDHLPPSLVHADQQHAQSGLVSRRCDLVHGALEPVGELRRAGQSVDVVENQEERLLLARLLEKLADRVGEVAFDDLEIVAVEPELERGAEEANPANAFAQRVPHLPVPWSFDAVLQQAIEDPVQHPIQVLHASQVDVTANHSVMTFCKPAYKARQGTLADAALPADEAHPSPAVLRGSHQAADPLDLAPASHEQLDGNGRSGRKRT